MIISQIVAIGADYVIGKDNQLLWHYPEDLQYFKNQTLNKVMIMGRKTFDSLGKPLPKRHHIVISRKAPPEEYANHPRVQFTTTLDEAMLLARKAHSLISPQPEDIMIVGGAEIYKLSLDITDRIYLTRINKSFDGDTYYSQSFHEKFKLFSCEKSPIHPEITYEVWSKT